MTPDQIIYIVVGALLFIALVLMREQIAAAIIHGVPSVYRIAGMTFAETRRRRILQVVILLSLLVLAGMLSITWLSPSEPEKALISGGLDLIFMLGILMSIFICAYLIPTDIERRTIYSVLSKPVNRWEFVVGRYFGVLAVIAMLVAIMLIVQMIILFAAFRYPEWKVLQAGVLAFFGMAVFAAAVMVVSSIASSLTTVIVGVVLWLIGSLQAMSHSIISHAEGFNKTFLSVISSLVPHLGKYDFRGEAAEHLTINMQTVERSLLYGAAYIAVCMILASLLFKERQV